MQFKGDLGGEETQKKINFNNIFLSIKKFIPENQSNIKKKTIINMNFHKFHS